MQPLTHTVGAFVCVLQVLEKLKFYRQNVRGLGVTKGSYYFISVQFGAWLHTQLSSDAGTFEVHMWPLQH